MHRKGKGLEAVLLFALFFCMTVSLCGCAGRSRVYTAGGQTEVSEKPGEDAETDGSISLAAGQKSDSEDAQAAGQKSDADSQTTDQTEAIEPETEGYVYVCGAVCSPGVYPIHRNMRVFEAVELAGGFAQDADETWINQAGLLYDGQQLYIYTEAETQELRQEAAANGGSIAYGQDAAGGTGAGRGTETAGNAGAADTSGSTGAVAAQAGDVGTTDGKVNINTADLDTLMTLPGIGQAKAEAIIQYRTEHGPFASIEEIQNISGIKQAVFSKIEDRITV
jgi:competence protein ComEA